MEEKNSIAKLTEMVQNKAGLTEDFSRVTELLRDSLQKKYVDRLHEVVTAAQEEVQTHPPKEVRLLRALRDCMGEQSRPRLEQCIHMLFMLNTIQSMHGNLAEVTRSTVQTIQMSSSDESPDSLEAERALREAESSAQVTELLLTMALMKMI